MSLREQIRELADDVLAKGGDADEVRLAVFARFNLVIGQGGQGSAAYEKDYPKCRYCGAWGGGGHGGLCPGGYYDTGD